MPQEIIDLDPTESIAIEAMRDPSELLFLIQGQKDGQLVTLIIDHEQAVALSLAGGELLELLEETYAREINQFEIPSAESLVLREPVDPLFEIAEFQLGYDADRDYLVIITLELPIDPGIDASDLGIVRFWITREQMVALIRQIDQLILESPPVCPACGQLLQDKGHICLRAN
jgi:uncharacterized repeat protein (TIGR03847 family)